MSDTQTAEHAGTDVLPDAENRARAQGWRPKDEFKGPPEKWKDAETFLEVADQFLPVAMQQNRALEDKFGRAESEIRGLKTELADVKQVLTDFREFATRGEQRAFDRAMKELTERRAVAVQHADTEAFNAVDAEIADLNKTGKPAAAAVTKPNGEDKKPVPVADPDVVAFVTENPWFNSDKEMHEFAKSQDAFLANTKPGMAMKDRLAAVKARVMKEYPDKFANPAREGASTVATPSGSASQRRDGNKHAYENLPPEAKKACDKFVRTIPGFKREDYLRDYEWE